MLKYSIFLAAMFGTTLAAYAAIALETPVASNPRNVTVIYKSSVWPVQGPIVVETCRLEDCSDTPES